MLAEFLRLLVRRWLLTSLCVLLGVAAAGAALFVVAPVQRSEAAVLFVPPSQDASVEGTLNPFLSLGGSMGVVPTVVQTTVTDERTASRLNAAGHLGRYEVTDDIGENAAPILRVSVDSDSVAQSEGTARAVVAEIQQQLLVLQRDRAVDPRYYITSTVITATPTPIIVRTRQIQAAGVVGIAVIVLGFAGVGLASRGRLRRAQPAVTGAAGLPWPSGVNSTIALTSTATPALALNLHYRPPTPAAPATGDRSGLTATPEPAGPVSATPLSATPESDPFDGREDASALVRVAELAPAASAPTAASAPKSPSRRRGRRTFGPAPVEEQARPIRPNGREATSANGHGVTDDRDDRGERSS